MDLKQNKITISELYASEKAKRIIERSFPVLCNPFLQTVALKMSLENTLKLASGSHAQEQVDKVLADLKSI